MSEEKKYYGQCLEDQVLEHIFNCIGTTNKVLVDLGSGNTTSLSNTCFFRKQGWAGFLFDGLAENYFGKVEDPVVATESLKIYPNDRGFYAWITSSNIKRLFEEAQIPKQFDLLDCDIDGQDYWVVRRLLETGYQPRVFCAEYNRKWEVGERMVVGEESDYKWNRGYFSGSYTAFEDLGRQHGYHLACAIGCNIMFVHGDENRQKLKHIEGFVPVNHLDFPTAPVGVKAYSPYRHGIPLPEGKYYRQLDEQGNILN